MEKIGDKNRISRMKIRVTFDITLTEKTRLQKIIGKNKGIHFNEYRNAIKELLKKSLSKMEN